VEVKPSELEKVTASQVTAINEEDKEETLLDHEDEN